ncbi:MAG: hypothetical protein HYZ29_07915 [Myxococcales bacterium]|nr:hypothetical protein [Myxococcales bacterium]
MNRIGAGGAFDDAALASEALEVVVRASNRVVHVAAYVGKNQKPVPMLDLFDLEELVCEDHHGAGAPRQIPSGGLLTKNRIRVKEPPASQMADVQKRLNAPSSVFLEAESLWHDSVEAFYDGRPREAIILLRAAIEVGWHAGFDQAAEAYRRCPWGTLPVALLDSIVERAKNKRTPVPQQLDEYSKTVFGFSFRKDWEPDKTEKWDRLNSFFDERHAVAHRTGVPRPETLWAALSLTREVLDKVKDLADAVVASCPPPGSPSP